MFWPIRYNLVLPPTLHLSLFSLGANGAGKTTTFRMLVNDIKPSSGEIIINWKKYQ